MKPAEPTGSLDPRTFIEAPVIGALNGIVVRAVIGFGLVAGSATLPLILRLEGDIHQAFHFLLPVAWVAYAAVTAVVLILRPPPAESDVWSRAAEIDPSLVRFARVASAVMMGGWLASVGAVVVHHHLTSPQEAFLALGVIVPLAFAAWLLAVLAWTSWCRASLARAEHQATGRLRRHMTELSQSKEPR